MVSNSSGSFGFCHHFECVLLNTIVKLPHEVVSLDMVLDAFCQEPITWSVQLPY